MSHFIYKIQKVTSSLFFLSTLNYDARSTTHQIHFNFLKREQYLNYLQKFPHVPHRGHSAHVIKSIIVVVQAIRFKQGTQTCEKWIFYASFRQQMMDVF